MTYWTVVLEARINAFQYGMLPVCVEADTKEEAEKLALEQHADDGVSELKVLFTMEPRP